MRSLRGAGSEDGLPRDLHEASPVARRDWCASCYLARTRTRIASRFGTRWCVCVVFHESSRKLFGHKRSTKRMFLLRVAARVASTARRRRRSMSAPTLFDTHALHPSDPRAVVTRQARARREDPSPSHEAAARVNDGSKELQAAVRWWVSKRREPVTAFQIAAALCGQRWSYQTVLSGVSRSGLTVVDEEGESPRGRRCTRYSL